MKKLRELIEKTHYDGKLPKGLTPYMVENMIYIYNALVRGEQPEFIEQEIKNTLTKCGIKTKEQGIGWIAYR